MQPCLHHPSHRQKLAEGVFLLPDEARSPGLKVSAAKKVWGSWGAHQTLEHKLSKYPPELQFRKMRVILWLKQLWAQSSSRIQG